MIKNSNEIQPIQGQQESIVFLDYLRFFAMFMVFGVHASECVYYEGLFNFSFHDSELERHTITWLTTLTTLATYAVSYLCTKLISFIPGSKYIIG